MGKNMVIIGAGELGRALETILIKQGNNLDLWDIQPGLVENQKDLTQLIATAEMIFVCIPSRGLISLLQKIGVNLKQESIIAIFSKGLNPDTLQTTAQIMSNNLPDTSRFALLGGPMLAEEIFAGKISAATVAANTSDIYEEISEVFVPERIRLEYSADINGVSVLSVLKNVYALGAGILSGESGGSNLNGLYVHRIFHETMTVLHVFGGKKESLFLYAGIADYIATAGSRNSSNFSLGLEIAKGGTLPTELSSEGSRSAPALVKLLRQNNLPENEFPILVAIAAIITGELSAVELKNIV